MHRLLSPSSPLPGFTPEERASFADNLVAGCGLVDTFRAQYPEAVSELSIMGSVLGILCRCRAYKLVHPVGVLTRSPICCMANR